MELYVAACTAGSDVSAKPAGFTCQDGPGGFLMFIRLEIPFPVVTIISVFPDHLDLKISQGLSLPSYQGDWGRKKVPWKTGGHIGRWRKGSDGP